MEGDEKQGADEAEQVANHHKSDTTITDEDPAPVESNNANQDASHRAATKSSDLEQHPELHKWATFLRGVVHFDTTKMEPWIGLRNALGVCAPLAAGIALGMPWAAWRWPAARSMFLILTGTSLTGSALGACYLPAHYARSR